MSGLNKPIQIKSWHVLLAGAMIFIIALSAMGYITIGLNSAGDQDGNGNTNPSTGTSSTERKVNFAVTDYFNGSAPSGTLTVYKSGSDTAYETLTVTSGSVESAKTYKSGWSLNILYTSGNTKYWQPASVPTQRSGDAQAGILSTINLDSFIIGTYATDALTFGATAINDAGTYNSTTSGNTPTFDYKLSNTGDTNTGLIESSDPTTDYKYDVYVLVKFSGTGAETIGLSNAGFDDTMTIGTTQYGWIHCDPNALTIWKDSTGAYKYNEGVKCAGTDTFNFSPDFTGYSGTAVTMQITPYMYFDPTYLQDHNGAIPSSAYQIAEQTVTCTV